MVNEKLTVDGLTNHAMLMAIINMAQGRFTEKLTVDGLTNHAMFMAIINMAQYKFTDYAKDHFDIDFQEVKRLVGYGYNHKVIGTKFELFEFPSIESRDKFLAEYTLWLMKKESR